MACRSSVLPVWCASRALGSMGCPYSRHQHCDARMLALSGGTRYPTGSQHTCEATVTSLPVRGCAAVWPHQYVAEFTAEAGVTWRLAQRPWAAPAEPTSRDASQKGTATTSSRAQGTMMRPCERRWRAHTAHTGGAQSHGHVKNVIQVRSIRILAELATTHA